MAVSLTMHALQRMAERGITETQVQGVLDHPAGNPQPGRRGNTIEYSDWLAPGKQLIVVVDSADRERVVTVFVREVQQ